ncbi:tail assembly protein [Escherichia coli]|nr:tail assembly protein [Escherichia coli]
MIELNLHGKLASHFGKKVTLNTDTPRNAINVLIAQSQAFKRDLLSGPHNIKVNGKELTEDDYGMNLDARYSDATIHITPVIEGGFAGVSLATWIIVGVSVASVAFSIFMAHNMKVKTSAEAAQDNSITNNTYTNIENRVGQGRPVPILLGEMKVGSNVGSLGIDTTNNKDALDVVS